MYLSNSNLFLAIIFYTIFLKYPHETWRSSGYSWSCCSPNNKVTSSYSSPSAGTTAEGLVTSLHFLNKFNVSLWTDGSSSLADETPMKENKRSRKAFLLTGTGSSLGCFFFFFFFGFFSGTNTSTLIPSPLFAKAAFIELTLLFVLSPSSSISSYLSSTCSTMMSLVSNYYTSL